MADSFSYTTGTISINISDNSSSRAASVINVSGHDLFILHVQVSVSATHPYPGDIGIELTSPSGTITKLMNINSELSGTNLTNVYFGANGFYGERSKGSFTLKIVD